jgi:hypothetical protein
MKKEKKIIVSFKAEIKRTLESDGNSKHRGRGKLK